MKVNVSVLIGCVLCVVMIAGIRVLRSVDEHHDMWRPNDIYSQVGGSTFSSVSYSPSPAVSSGVSVSMSAGSNSLFRRRAPFFSARVNNPSPMTNGQSPISVGGSSVGAIHTTSSAQYRSFGSGAGAGVSMSGGTVRANASQPSASMASVSMPSMPTASPILLTSSNSQSAPAEAILANNSAYQGIGNTTGGGARGMSGRRKAPPSVGSETSWVSWIEAYYSRNNWLGEEPGTYGLDYYQLHDMYHEFLCDAWNNGMGDLPTWDEWLAWFMASSDGYTSATGNKYSFVPLGDILPLILFALLYALLRVYKSFSLAKFRE